MKRLICLLPVVLLLIASSLFAQSIPSDKYVHLTKGMSEAEVLSRFGSPTTVSYDSTRTRGRVGSGKVDLQSSEVKIFNYVGQPGEWITIIYIQSGKVIDYKRTK